jgi:pilus assembly protein CpaF
MFAPEGPEYFRVRIQQVMRSSGNDQAVDESRGTAPGVSTPTLPEGGDVIGAPHAPLGVEEQCRRISAQLVERLDLTALSTMNLEQIRQDLRQVVEHLIDQDNPSLGRDERDRLVDEVLDETFGLGPLDALLRDPRVDEICVNGPERLYCRRRENNGPGKLHPVVGRFRDRTHLLQVVERLTARPAETSDDAATILTRVLQNGWHLQLVTGTCATTGPFLRLSRLTRPEVELASIAPREARALAECLASRRFILVCGGAGSGKSMLIDALARLLPQESRIVTAEQVGRLQLPQPHVLPLVLSAGGEIPAGTDTGALIAAAHALRAEWIVVDELCPVSARGVVDAILSDDTAVLASVRARDPQTALTWLEGMLLVSSAGLPASQVRHELAAALDVVVHVHATADGATQIAGAYVVTVDDAGWKLGPLV